MLLGHNTRGRIVRPRRRQRCLKRARLTVRWTTPVVDWRLAHDSAFSAALDPRIDERRLPPTPLNSLLDECVSRARMRWTRSRWPWMLALVGRSPSGDGHRPPVPVVYRGTEGRPGPVLFTLDVDGERFAVRRAGDGGTLRLLSGPNKGYGFGSNRTPNRSVEEHRESLRAFLTMIDPNTGYIGDE
jgi:hypothetical protein